MRKRVTMVAPKKLGAMKLDDMLRAHADGSSPSVEDGKKSEEHVPDTPSPPAPERRPTAATPPTPEQAAPAPPPAAAYGERPCPRRLCRTM